MLGSGSLLDNRYRLDERIASGGMGDVWKGTDVVLGRTIAVKVLRSAMLTDPEFAARFYGEARMMAAFRHPGVVEVYDYSAGEAGDDDKCAYLVMAYVEGDPLSAKLKDQGRLSVAETMSVVAQAADALHAAHENGTVHRDVKPGNLIVKPNGTVILVDFGVARSDAVTSVTGLNAIVGTALYMAPEQVAKGTVSAATDIYALGAVAYHCILGDPPFDGDNALQVALRHLEEEPEPLPESIAPPAVRELITKAMAKNPADRFLSAAEFAEAAMASVGSLDWRNQTGTAMTRTALVRPSSTGTSLIDPAAAGAASSATRLGSRTSLHGQAMPGRSATGTAMTRPVSPVAGGYVVPGQRNLLEAAPPSVPQQARPQQPKGQQAVLITVIALFVLAAGLAVAIFLNAGNDSDKDRRGNVNPGGVPAASLEPEQTPESEEPAEEETNEAPVQQEEEQEPEPTLTSTQPTTKPTTTPPTTKPTTTPPTTEPTTTPPSTPADDDPTTGDPGDDGDDGTGTGDNGAGTGGGTLLGG